ncbi:MAG TPA: hypothetical protein VH417_05995 [Vicinamibacterales bacterium]|jgi:hypothetical protein
MINDKSAYAEQRRETLRWGVPDDAVVHDARLDAADADVLEQGRRRAQVVLDRLDLVELIRHGVLRDGEGSGSCASSAAGICCFSTRAAGLSRLRCRLERRAILRSWCAFGRCAFSLDLTDPGRC